MSTVFAVRWGGEFRGEKTMAARAFIVTFHGIGPVPSDIPAAERPYWAPESQFAKLVPAVLSAAKAAGLQPVFTFDDGNLSDLRIAAPLLKAAGARGIFFPCTGRIGKAGYLGAEDIRALQRDGFEIGSHGIDHLPWGTLSGAVLEAEVGQSKRVLEEVTGRPVVAAAMPFGSYRRQSLAALRRAGYRAVYSSDPALCAEGRWFCPRFSYRADRPFVPGDLIAMAQRLSHRLPVAAKGLIKALR